MEVIKKENYKVPVFSWCSEIEENAMSQIDNLAQLPFVFNRISIMSDCHQGYGMPIGGVIATKDVVIPNAVGVDIGCGMRAVKTNLCVEGVAIDQLKTILGFIRKRIPVGFKHHDKPHPIPDLPNCEMKICTEQYESATKQVGTLGGGNHFIEIQRDQDGFIWFMIHSGSRNLGKKVADYYNKIAQRLNADWYSSVPKNWELAFLPMDTAVGICYLSEMEYCLQFAAANRDLMAEIVKDIFYEVDGDVLFSDEVNIHHNYAAMENHFGCNVMIHRKGATRARKNEVGIIPGSQGTHSYIVSGLGNPDSFMSCSHGAGRCMGRKEAIRSLDFDTEVYAMEAQGILHAIRNKNDLDEATGAYKNIDTVMAEQSDLVSIFYTLTPMAVVKG